MAGHVVLVLGCHRSGTSLVANALPCLGASLGPRAAWGGRDNPNFGEDLDVLAIDEQIMMAFSRSWDTTAPMPANFERHPMLEFSLGAQALALMADRLTAYPLYGLKEPRMCRLLPFWRKVFAQVGCKVSVVFVVRHPLAVAASLAKRNGMPREKALALWLAYVNEARNGVDPAWPSTTVQYDQMAVLPRVTIQEIGYALELVPDEAVVEKFADEFVDRSLWHQDEGDDGALPAEVLAAWKLEQARAARGMAA
jgi:hypothetical protein